MLDPAAARAEFPIVEERVFLNSAALGPIPRRSAGRMTEAVTSYLGLHCESWKPYGERVRAMSARLVNARPDQVAFVKNTSEGMSIAANGLDWQPGDNVIVPASDFPSVLFPWLNLVDRGLDVRRVPAAAGRLPVDALRSAVDSRTRAIALSSVQFGSGFRCDLAGIGQLCRDRDLLFIVDGIQSLGALRTDMAACGIDVLTADAHKWLLGPQGIGIFVCSDRALKRLRVSTVGWLSMREPFAFDYRFELHPDARRFEPGSENTVGIFGLGGTLELIEEFGIAAIERRILDLTDAVCERLPGKGYRILSPRGAAERSGIVIFDSAVHRSEALFERLTAAGIVVAPRGGGIRVSPHYFNTGEELEQLVDTLP